jgi:hypothetical protein
VHEAVEPNADLLVQVREAIGEGGFLRTGAVVDQDGTLSTSDYN